MIFQWYTVTLVQYKQTSHSQSEACIASTAAARPNGKTQKEDWLRAELLMLQSKL
jgi:hypothetical protein